MEKKIAIIGAGVMGQAIAKSFLAKKIITPSDLLLTNIIFNGLEEFAHQGVTVSGDNSKAISFADIIILAVKPQMIDAVLAEIKNTIKKSQLLISIAAGISVTHIETILGEDKKIVRVMPNLGAQIGESMSCWVKNKNVLDTDIHIIKTLLTTIGKETELMAEEDIDKITPISGSGPAYIFYLAELLEKEAIAMGLRAEEAHLLVKQIFIGSCEIIKNTDKSFKTLRENVTSKGGVTEQALRVFHEKNLEEIFHTAMKKAYKKAKELNKIA